VAQASAVCSVAVAGIKKFKVLILLPTNKPAALIYVSTDALGRKVH
jgi:hypothetical protein